jgi:hypothetical protein
MKYYLPAIFIPFPQHHDCTGRKDAAFEAVAASEAWLREQEFGLVVDRLRIAETAAQGLGVRDATARQAIVDAVEKWITAALEAARLPG